MLVSDGALRYDPPEMNRAVTVDDLRRALEPLWQAGNLRMVVLFGTLGTDRADSANDLDLALLPDGPIDETRVTAEVVRLTHWNDVDLVHLGRADPLTAMEIARSGIVLFCDDPSTFTEFCSLAFRRYVDSEKLRRAQRRSLELWERRHESR